MKSPLQFNSQWRKINGPGVATNELTGPDHRRSDEETAAMADTSQYSDSAPTGKTEPKANTWKSLGDLARALVERADAK